MTTTTAKAFRAGTLRMLQEDGVTLAEYIRPMVDFGHTRAFIINYHVELGFFDEEVDGALIELGVTA